MTKTTLHHYSCNDCSTDNYIHWKVHEHWQHPFCAECGSEERDFTYLGEVILVYKDDLASLEQANKDLRRQNNNLRKFKERVKNDNN